MEAFWRRGKRKLASGSERDAGVLVHRFRAQVLPLHGLVSRTLSLVPWAPIGLTMAPPGMVLPDLWRTVRAGGGFDVVHASAYPSFMYMGLVAARRSGAKLVLMPCSHFGRAGSHGPLLPRRITGLYRQANALIALTDSERQVLIGAGVPAEQVTVTGAGLNPETSQGADGTRFRQAYGLASGSPVVAFVGHKTAGKGALHLLEACRHLLAQRPDLTVAMTGEETPAFIRRYQALPDQVRARILNLGLSDEQKQDMLAASDLLVLPSQDDSFGIVLLEAWSHGLPVIGARAGGIPNVIEEGRTGLLVPFGDVDALRQAITWMLEHPTEAAEMGTQGRATTLQRWTWDAVYARVEAVYRGCLSP